MSVEVDPVASGMRPWVRILLIVSLALNVLVLGAVAGVAIQGGPFHAANSPQRTVDAAIGPLTRAISDSDRRAIARQLRQGGRTDGWTPEDHAEALQRMLVILQTTPFDADRFEMEFSQSMDGLKMRMSRASEAMVQRLSDMSETELAAYAARVEDEMQRERR